MSGNSYHAPKAHGQQRACHRCGRVGIVGGGFYGDIAEMGGPAGTFYACKDGRECSLRADRKARSGAR